MPIEPINTLPIEVFIQTVKQSEASRAKEVRIDLNTAKNLAFTLGIVMARMNGDLEKFVKENAGGEADQIIDINMDAGGWK